ncbi:acylneuraminate cytidylyltransferase family protein [Heyndrickxia sp. FSL K6-6286]|uniref:acylneuraminate cytidylyltransferase family protein n=1 Tax=Heyndrickxia sp. FSL K6-6286 TaxID=2921510 RepID=UPI00217E6E46|nr:acylneuraminate cytidylyltransferase family protein [Heyndrickxia oleronia]
MIGDKSVLAIIPARGGSKGIKRKNIKAIAGKPLIAWTIKEAQKSQYIDRIILSSEDMEIINVAKSYGCEVPFTRPIELAQDDTPGVLPVLHAIKKLKKYDYIVLLQPTSPLRKTIDIDYAIELLYKKNGVSCVSVTETDNSPYWMYYIDQEHNMKSIITDGDIPMRRQAAPKVFSLNGAIYVSDSDYLMKTKSLITDETLAYIMPYERSIDIDTEMDFLLCDLLLTRLQNE